MLRGFIQCVLCACVLLWVGAAGVAQELNRPAPNCPLKHWHSGQALSLEAFKGRVVYVDFWASWCAPCAESLPFLQHLQQEFGGRGLVVLGVNLDAQRADAEAFLRQHPVQFSLAASPAEQCPKAFGVAGMPAAYLIDRQGRIRHEHLGFKTSLAASLRAQVEQLLNEPTQAPSTEHTQ